MYILNFVFGRTLLFMLWADLPVCPAVVFEAADEGVRQPQAVVGQGHPTAPKHPNLNLAFDRA